MEKPLRSAKDIFQSAMEFLLPSERQAYLDRACANAPQIRREVDGLLEAHEQAGSFLEKPAEMPEVDDYAVSGAVVSGTVDYEPSGKPAELSSTDASSAAMAPGTRVGRYKVIKKIAEGGMGAV